MMRSILFFFFVAVIQLLSYHYGQAMTIDVHWDQHLSRPTAFSFTCSVKVNRFVLMQVSKDGGAPLITLHSHDTYYSREYKDRILSESQLTEEMVTLKATITHVVPGDSGVYTCAHTFLDTNGDLVVSKSSAEMRLQRPSDDVKGMLDRLSKMESLLGQQERRLAQQEDYIQYLENNTMERLEKVSMEINGVAQMQKYHTHLIGQVSERETTVACAFSTAFPHPSRGGEVFTLDNRDKLALPEAFDVGSNYDEERGVFTAPKDGIYAFQLHNSFLLDHPIAIDLIVKDAIVATITNERGESVSTVHQLQTGDEVAPVARLLIDQEIFPNTEAAMSQSFQFEKSGTLFSGYLIRTI